MISFTEYLERIPKGLIPNTTGLINARKQQQSAPAMAEPVPSITPEGTTPAPTENEISNQDVLEYIKQNNPELYERFMSLPPEEQERAMQMMNSANATKPEMASGV